jgi:hypothetical protein
MWQSGVQVGSSEESLRVSGSGLLVLKPGSYTVYLNQFLGPRGLVADGRL